MTSPTTLEVRTKDGVKFGKELRDKEFMFEKGFLNLNHGEFLKSVQKVHVGGELPCRRRTFLCYFTGRNVNLKHRSYCDRRHHYVLPDPQS
jgi:hypothetical protein